MIPERVDRKKLYIFDLGGVTLDNVDLRPEWLSQIKVDKDEFYRTYLSQYAFPSSATWEINFLTSTVSIYE